MSPFETLYSAWKDLPNFSGWSKPETETGYIWFDAPLSIGGVVEQGFVLHGGCYIGRPDVNVSFEMRVRQLPARRTFPLARYDWRPLDGGHTNKRRNAPDGHAGKRVNGSHLHSFELNWNQTLGRFRGDNLPFAENAGADLESFEAVRGFVGERFRIGNIDRVIVPEWTGTLF